MSFELFSPPKVSRWFVNFSDWEEWEYKKKPRILNADDSLILMRMVVIDYFIYKASPGKLSLNLIPGPYPKIYLPKQIGIVLPYDDKGQHYAVVFPARWVESHMDYEMHIFSSVCQAWCTKVANIVIVGRHAAMIF